jgi:hypothetical protein
MAAFQIESDVCHGRGFAGADPDGFLAKLYAWVTLTPASGGPGWYIHDDQSSLGTDPYIVISDASSPSVNSYNTGKSGGAPKFIRILLPTTTAGHVEINSYLWWDNTTQTGYGLWSGTFLETYDDADFVYDFRGGDECMIIQTRLGTDWDTFVLDDFVGDSNLLEAATAVGVMQSGVSAGSSVVLQLDTGEAANFTADNYYYIFDMDGHSWVEYCQVTNVSIGADQITVDAIGYDFPSGAVIGAFPHRYYMACNNLSLSGSFNYSNRQSKLPYCSSDESGYVFHDQSGLIYGRFTPTRALGYLLCMDPGDDGVYAVQRPGIAESYRENTNSYASTDQNRGYGVTKNVYLTSLGSMARGQDGRVISSENWLYFQKESDVFSGGSGAIAVLFRDTESTS